MTKTERNLVSWIDSHLPLLLFVTAGILGAWIRFSLRSESGNGDLTQFLLPWYDTIRANGGLHALGSQVGDYNVLYQFVIALMTYLPVKPLYAYKLLSVCFDFLLAGAGSYLAFLHSDRSAWKASVVWSAVLLLPPVWLNSACWAQCDSIYVFFCVLSLVFLSREKYVLCFIAYGLAFAFKLQAVFLLPFFLFAWIHRKRFSILHFLILPAVLILSGLPGVLFGRGLLDVFRIYADQTGTWPFLFLNYPNVWAFVSENAVTNAQYHVFRMPAVLLTFGMLSVFTASLLHRQEASGGAECLRAALLLCWTCVMFLPGMHERYDYPVLILCSVVAVLDHRFLPVLAGISILSLCGYADFLFDTAPDWRILAAIHVALYISAAALILRGQASSARTLRGA